MLGRGVLSLLLFFLLLHSSFQHSYGNVVLLSRLVVMGAKAYRVSIPLTVSRLKDLYLRWRTPLLNGGIPKTFSRLKIPLAGTVIYIGAANLMQQFYDLYSLEGAGNSNPLVSPLVDGIGEGGDVCIEGYSVMTEYNRASQNITFVDRIRWTGNGWTLDFYTVFRPKDYQYYIVDVTLRYIQNGQLVPNGTFKGTVVMEGEDRISALSSLQSCAEYGTPKPGEGIDTGSGASNDALGPDIVDSYLRDRVLPSLADAPIEVYPSSLDPFYDDALELPPAEGDSVVAVDQTNGEATTDQPTDQPTDQDTTQNIVLPDVNTYDPEIPDIPERKDIYELISDFVSDSPLMRWVEGARIDISAGSCTVAGTFMGQTVTLDFCWMGPYLNILGSIVLAFAHLYALYIVFGRA